MAVGLTNPSGAHMVGRYGPAFRITTPASLAWEKQKIKTGVRPMQPAVARSFGDLELKTPVPYMTCQPEVTVHALAPGASYVLLACDGVWDVLTNEAAAAFVLGEPPADGEDGPSLRDRAGAVVKAAYDGGSTDNISAIVIRLDL